MNDPKWFGRVFLSLFLLSAVVGIVLVVLTAAGVSRNTPALPEKPSLFAAKQIMVPGDTIAVLNIFSQISYASEDSYFDLERSGSIYWVSALRSIEDNPNVKAVIIRINSPGGTIAATQELYNEIFRLKDCGKIVTVSMGDMAASGAFYIACAADYIMANPGTLTGSIGVIMANLDLSGLMKKYGVGYNVIKSGKNKDLLSSYRKMTSEEEKLLQDVVMDAYEQFFRAVQKGRKIKAADLRPIADGRIFTGRQALRMKLIDGLGDFEDTIEKTAKLCGIKGEPNIIDLKPEGTGFLKYLTSSVSGIFGRMNPLAKEAETVKRAAGPLGGSSSPILYMYGY